MSAPVRLALAVCACATATALVCPGVARAEAQADVQGTHESTPGPWVAHANVGMPVATYVGASGSQADRWYSPGDRFAMLQLVGIGRWVHPHVRLNFTLQFAETFSGIPQSVSGFTMMGAIAWAAYTAGPFFGGLGGVVAPRSYGSWDVDAGIFSCLGIGVPLGGGWNAGVAVQAPLMLLRRVSFLVSPALFLAYRF